MITILLLCVILLLCIVSLRYYMFHYGRIGRLIHLIPGPPAFPILGIALEIYNLSQEKFWLFKQMMCNKYYPIIKIWTFTVVGISIRHPDDIEIILSSSKHIEKGVLYSFIHPWVGTGLLTSSGSKWHKRRKMLTPAFHFHILKQYINILIEESNCMTKYLEDIEGSIIDDLESFISKHTLNAICATAMGTSLQDMGTFGREYRQAIHDLGQILIYRIMKPWFYYDKIFALSPMGRKHSKCLNILHEFTKTIIANRKQYHKLTDGQYLKNFKNEIVTETNDMETPGIRKKRLAMLDLLIAASYQNEINDSAIQEEIDTFMFEGHDTVAMALSFALLLLAEHKDIQDRIRDEVNTVIQENGGVLTMTALHNLLYLERCLKESLRLYPSVHFIARQCTEDVKLQSYVVPSGIPIHINIYDLHRDPNFWPNPDVFDPDRFLPDKIQNRHPYSYIPFSAGPRNCIGQRFAMMELKAIVASLIHKFYLEPIDYLKDIRFKIDIVLRAAHPIRIKFISIDRMRSSKTSID